jgi:hypothetical protein
VAVFFLALMEKMKSASWIELGSASFLCLGLKPTEPGVGNSFPQISQQAVRGGREVDERVRGGSRNSVTWETRLSSMDCLWYPQISDVSWSYPLLPLGRPCILFYYLGSRVTILTFGPASGLETLERSQSQDGPGERMLGSHTGM